MVADQMFQIVAVRHKISGQFVQQGRVDGRVGGAEVIGGMYDAPSEHLFPHPVHGGFGEERVVFGRDPLRQFHAQVAARVGNRLFGGEEFGLHHLPGAQLPDFAVVVGIDR